MTGSVCDSEVETKIVKRLIRTNIKETLELCRIQGGVVVAHEILETAQSPKSSFPFWNWGWDFGLGHGIGLVNNLKVNKSDSTRKIS